MCVTVAILSHLEKGKIHGIKFRCIFEIFMEIQKSKLILKDDTVGDNIMKFYCFASLPPQNL